MSQRESTGSVRGWARRLGLAAAACAGLSTACGPPRGALYINLCPEAKSALWGVWVAQDEGARIDGLGSWFHLARIGNFPKNPWADLLHDDERCADAGALTILEGHPGDAHPLCSELITWLLFVEDDGGLELVLPGFDAARFAIEFEYGGPAPDDDVLVLHDSQGEAVRYRRQEGERVQFLETERRVTSW